MQVQEQNNQFNPNLPDNHQEFTAHHRLAQTIQLHMQVYEQNNLHNNHREFIAHHSPTQTIQLRMQVNEQNNQFVYNPSDNTRNSLLITNRRKPSSYTYKCTNKTTNSTPTFPTTTANSCASPLITDRHKPSSYT